ncbi:hypothetical protein ASD62_05105 [Phycicoccus sp. Root563]|nr:hypothetical protein ASD62_05105 [Phycicoccus sp. Root563]
MAVPPAASKKTPEGAEAFARFYTESMDAAMVAGSSAEITALSLRSCNACTRLIKVVDERAAKGQHQEKRSFTLGASQLDPSSSNTRPIVEVLVTNAGGRIVDQEGVTVSKLGEERLNFRHTLAWRDGWRVEKSELIR